MEICHAVFEYFVEYYSLFWCISGPILVRASKMLVGFQRYMENLIIMV